jgi:hypothetical protein
MLAHADSTHEIKTQAQFQNTVGIDGLRPPALLQTAWQTAVATGALTHLGYETVSALSLTYTLQDRFREDSRTGFQTIMQTSDFKPGEAEIAVRSADNYLRETVTSENDLRATYAQAEQMLTKQLGDDSLLVVKDSTVTQPRPQAPTRQ